MTKEKREEIQVADLMDMLLKQAISERASDIHIEPLHDRMNMRVRFRIDGTLKEKATWPISAIDPLVSRLKVLSNLDISIHNTPQEGHFEMDINLSEKEIVSLDVRVSIFPTVHGEAAALRVLNHSEALFSLEEIGMNEKDLQTVKKLIPKLNGVILVTGPSGSGKSTTLYAILQKLNSKERNIVTLEDPVELFLDNVRHIQIQPEHGLTFATGMRSILRQDPDIIMVGEIRDPETAEYAIRASLTGRIVFSTIHSNNSVGVIPRLIDMGIENSLIAYSLNGVISQRLVRKICPHCKTTYTPNQAVLEYFGLDKNQQYVKGAGCEKCYGTGYFGRTGIFETLEIDDTLRLMIIEKAHYSAFQEYVKKTGIKTIKEDAREKILAGITTAEDAAFVV